MPPIDTTDEQLDDQPGQSPADAPKDSKGKGDEGDGDKKYNQAEFDSKLATALKEREARIRRQYEQQQKEAAAAMEAQKLEDQAEWQKLANKRADEIKELKPRAQLAEAYERSVRALVEVYVADQPSTIQSILDKLPLPDQVEWLTQNASQVKAPPPLTTGRSDTNVWTPRGEPNNRLSDDEYMARKRAETQYK